MKKQPQHTPGPWFVDINGEGAITAPDGMLIARMQNAYRDDLRESNARLIAACPEMLDALEELVGAVERFIHPQPDKPGSAWAKLVRARAAIAKATGQTA